MPVLIFTFIHNTESDCFVITHLFCTAAEGLLPNLDCASIGVQK